MRIFLLFLGLNLCFCTKIFAQCVPTSNSTFGLPAVACPDEALNFINPHSSGFNYEWDFCTEDMLTTPSVSELVAPFNATPTESRLLFDDGEYFLFFLSYGSSKLFRIDLGNSPNNSPQAIKDFGNLGILSNPWTLQIIKDETSGLWFGITINYLTNQFIRLSFGNSLRNTPSASFMGSLAPSYTFISTTNLKKEGSNYYLFVVGYFTNSLAILDLGTNLSSNFSLTNIINEITFTSLVEPNDIDLIKDCGVWNLLITSTTGNRHLKFTSGFSNPPTISVYPYEAGFGTPTGLYVVQENGKFYALSIDVTGKAQVSNFGNSISSNAPIHSFLGTISSHPNFNNFYGIDGIFWESKILVFGYNYFASRLFRINFERNCGANSTISTTYNPTNITYRNVGSHPVVLNIKDINGNIIQRYEGTANINPTTTVGNFTANNVCSGNPVAFNNTSVGADSQVASWHWDFGDSNTSNLKNPTHTYASAGTYNVTLTVNNLNGCSNTITKQVTVSAGVTADFQEVPTACVGQAINFQNLSTYTNLPFDEANGFYWNFGDGTYSPFENPTKTYTTAGNYTITLTVKDQAGCTDIISRNINVLPNPAVSFNVPSVICAGLPVQFTSITSNATEFLWFFEGNGTSSEINPTVTFAQGGFYDVTLQVRNQNNCIATFTIENIQVLPAPNIIFNPQRVAGNPLSIRFENFSLGANQFLWDFGDGNTSNLPNPIHTFAQAGEYLVKLRATSANGCVSEFEKIVGVGTLRIDLAVLATRLENGEILAELANLGNTILNDITLQIQIADTTFTEIYAPILLPNQQKEITLSLALPTDLLNKANYFCLKALPKPSLRDNNLSNNETCWNIKNNFVVFEPYPNPAQKEINLSFTAPNEGILRLYIQDVVGKTITKNFLLSKGFNKETINIEGLAKGLYIFSFSFGDKIIHRKVVVE